jgi:replication-associated recombination protein RarA
MYGPPGNGKTSIARAFGNLVLSQSMYIPYALYLDGQVIKVYDAVSHTLAPDNEACERRSNPTGTLRQRPAATRAG